MLQPCEKFVFVEQRQLLIWWYVSIYLLSVDKDTGRGTTVVLI